jgi:transposase
MSSAEALVVLLLAVCWEQYQEIGRLTAEPAELVETNRGLVAELDELRRRNEELSRRLGLNSTNSSKPPSSDGLKRKRRTARSPERERRERLGRRPGKQEGGPGHHLALTTRPNQVVELLPAICEKCSGCLVEHVGEAGIERRQVMDLPPPSGLKTTEYQAIKLRCAGCGHVTKATFPEWAKAPAQYGPRMHAMANYLAVHQYDSELHLLYNTIGDRIEAIEAARLANALARLSTGDRVRIGHDVRPGYLHGLPATVVRRGTETITIQLDRPVGKFADGCVGCSPLAVELIGV